MNITYFIMFKIKALLLILFYSTTFCFGQNLSNKFIDKGNSLYRQGKFDSSLIILNKSINISEVDSQKARIYSIIGNVYEDKSKYKLALINYNKSLEIYKKINSDKGISKLYNQIGNVYYRWSDFNNAIKYYQKGLKLREQIKDKSGIPSSLNNIGNIYYSWGKFDKAITYYLNAYKLKKQLPDSVELPSYIINIGSAYLGLKNYKKANYYYNKALETAEINNNEYIKLTCYINIGVLNFEQNKLKEAVHYYKLAFNHLPDSINNLEKGYILRNLGETYIKQRKFLEAKQSLLRALKIAESENLNSLKSEIYNFLYIIENHNNNYKQALLFYKKSTEINDSIFNQQSIQKLNELQAKYDYEKKENEIKQKNIQITSKQKQIQLQQFLFILILSFLIVLSIIIYIVIKNKSSKKRIVLEKEINIQMQKALSAQMNPHFISNALNSIQKYFLNNDIEIANEYLADFGALIRLILEHSRKTKITLAEELKSTKLYISLEALRLDNKFKYNITIDKNINENKTLLPPIIIQPFIENAIWHGIAPKKENGNINIEFKLKDSYIVCIIQDDGIGVNKSKQLKKQYSNKRKSLGMNINQKRIELLNKSDKRNYFINILDLSTIDRCLTGTRVEIKMPYDKI